MTNKYLLTETLNVGGTEGMGFHTKFYVQFDLLFIASFRVPRNSYLASPCHFVS